MARHRESSRALAFVAILATLLVVTARVPCARAQCTPQWLPGQGIPGVNGTVYALTSWDPDGPGPQPALLIVGGSFTFAGNIPANNIAAWDGTAWQALGNGVNNYVSALTTYNSELIAGGAFTSAGGAAASRIARWNGTSWSPLGLGTSSQVRALSVFDDGSGPALYAGGSFTVAGTEPANYVAKWDGTAWSPLGMGTNGSVYAVTVFNEGAGPALYVGGAFTAAGGAAANRVAKWSGTIWTPLADGMTDDVYALTGFVGPAGPTLYAGGRFLGHVTRWNGTSWSWLAPALTDNVNALVIFDAGTGPALYAGGDFAGANPWYIARWTGALWVSVGVGMNASISALTSFDDGSGPALYAGGAFTAVGNTGSVVPGEPAHGIARWKNATWSSLGTGIYGTILALTGHYDGAGLATLYAGGSFRTAGGGPANRVAEWDGANWSALGAGMNNDVTALTIFDDGGGPALYAGGLFTTAGASTANAVARWDGAGWSPLGAGVGGGPSASVSALTVFGDAGGPALYIGGLFTTAGGAPANYIAKWDGANWSSVGGGTNGQVRALAIFNDGSGYALYVAGGFTMAGGSPANRIAKWNGTSWSALGTGVAGGTFPGVNALAVFDDGSGPALYAGGGFTSAGGSTAAHIAKWNGLIWSPLGSGLGFESSYQARALTVFDYGSGPALYAGGIFSTPGGAPGNYIAKWNGTSWSSLGTGMGGSSVPFVYALTVLDDDGGPVLHVGGQFISAGGNLSAYWARWGCTSATPVLVNIATANPPLVNPYDAALKFRDVLEDTTTALVPRGIGVAGTPGEGSYAYAEISVVFSAPPSPTPSAANIAQTCTDIAGNGDLDCPVITSVNGSGAGPYYLTLSGPPPARECITFTFAGTNQGQQLQYQVLPGDTNLDGIVSTQDLLFLVQRISDGTANLPENFARYNINRSQETGGNHVNTQDLLRLVQLLNGTNATQAFNGVTVADCP